MSCKKKGKRKNIGYEVKITVVKRGYERDLPERFLASPQTGKCSVFHDGQEFLVTKENYNNFPYENHFCVAAWDVTKSKVYAALQADGVIIGSPVYFAAPNGALCSLLDRAFYATCTRSQLFKGKPAAALVTCAWAGGTASLDRLHRYFVPSQMPIVASVYKGILHKTTKYGLPTY